MMYKWVLTDLEEWLLHPKKTFLESHDTIQVAHLLAVEKCNSVFYRMNGK